ncbi:MAG: hypothetical protein JZU65_11975, partial [Chlorobium sp.]|nr:hypothetical protein [Chlorobium sp.]
RQLFLSAKPEKTNCQFPFRENSCQFVGNSPSSSEYFLLRINVSEARTSRVKNRREISPDGRDDRTGA